MTATVTGERLYNLLPAIIRLRDAAQGEPLRALLAIIEGELEGMEADIDGLYDDCFIETCANWVVPYLGDLVGNRPLHAVVQRSRADVAKTLSYRRRKGTLAVLEELARDVTGWGAHAVEFFQLLGWTQNLNHPRYQMAPTLDPLRIDPNAVERVGTVNLRAMDALDRLDGPFDSLTHTVDVRPPDSLAGWHNLLNLGIFIWRLQHYTLEEVPARPATVNNYGFHFYSYRNPVPLFNDPRREGSTTGQSEEIHVPGPIRALDFFQHPGRYYGPSPERENPGLLIIKDGVPVPVSAVVCKNLAAWDAPPPGKVAIDLDRARLAFAPGEAPSRPPQVTYTYGFSADIGGGPYDRSADLSQPAEDGTLKLEVSKSGAPSTLPTLQQALDAWQTARLTADYPRCLIRITDNGIYGGNLDLILPDESSWLAIEAENGLRPTLRSVGVNSLVAPDHPGEIVLNGLSIEGALELSGPLSLELRHCTLVPGRWQSDDGEPAFPDRDSLVVAAPDQDLQITISKSILGPIRAPEGIAGIEISDSILQAPETDGVPRPALAADDSMAEPGPITSLSCCTIFGPVSVRELRASAVIFVDPVRVQRRQVGCVRFSYLPRGSLVPRRYRCQPDLALKDAKPAEMAAIYARVRPEFTSEHFGDPGFAQLHLACAEEITRGAQDGAEMGAFNLLKNPQREANLRIRLDEYLPFGLKPGLIFVT